MSQTEDRTVACPSCGKPSTLRVHRRVDVTAEPELEAQLLDGRLFLFTCAACGHHARVVEPELLYQDAGRDLAIQLDALGTFDAEAASRGVERPKTTRVVRDSNALVEKVKIAHAGLDDRVVEAMKVLAKASMPDGDGKRLLFEAAEGEAEAARIRFTLLAPDGRAAGVGLARAAYEKLRVDLLTGGRLVDPGPWAVVDEAFARFLLAL
jgi:hypothetical protein